MPRPKASKSTMDKRRYWAGHHDDWRKSGLSQGEYCRRHSLSQSSLAYWRKKLVPLAETKQLSKHSAVTIVPVPFLEPPLRSQVRPASEALMVHVGRGFKIEVRSDFAPDLLEKLVLTLERL